MDKEEFEKYIFNSIVPLYPVSLDLPTKRVVIKLDSGPGWMNPKMMACLCLQGFYVYPGVPYTTAVSQEADRQYGPLKTKF